MALDHDIDRLYQLPLEQFTDARNTLAARVKAAGDLAGASRVRALDKPGVPAWAVNQLYWSARAEYDELVAAGTRLRSAQERSLKGGSGTGVRNASEAKERAVDAALRETIALIERASGEVSLAVRQRIAMTLEAIAILGGPGSVAPGRLVDDLPLPGFSALAALAPTGFTLRDLAARVGGPAGPPRPDKSGASSFGGGGPSGPPATEARARAWEDERARARDVERRARVDRARAELAAAESEARAARQALMKASLAEHQAAVKADAARLAVEEAKAQLSVAMTRATRAVDEHKLARRRAADVQATLERAEKAVAETRAALKNAQS